MVNTSEPSAGAPESNTLTSERVRPPIRFTVYESPPPSPSSVTTALMPLERSEEVPPVSVAIDFPARAPMKLTVYLKVDGPAGAVTETLDFPIVLSSSSGDWTSLAAGLLGVGD